MLVKKLRRLAKKAAATQKINCEFGNIEDANVDSTKLMNFIIKKLNSSLFKNKNAKIITSHFDEILPNLDSYSLDIFFIKMDFLMEYPQFKEKFNEGLKKSTSQKVIKIIFNNIWNSIFENEYNEFMSGSILETLSEMNLDGDFNLNILNTLNADNQANFLRLLIKNKCVIPYMLVEYKADNKKIIYDNLSFAIENASNLYALKNFVEERPDLVFQVNEYIDKHEEKAINSIFCETEHLVKITDPTLKEIIKLIVRDVIKNENVKFSDITYNGGGFSRILLIGDKVVKLGDRFTKTFPNNPYIIAPLLRKEFNFNGESCFVEVTERVDTSTKASTEEMYQLYKNLRDLGLVWTDVKSMNTGRLKKENIIHWRNHINPSEEILSLGSKRGTNTLQEGDLVILDADFIYDENDPEIEYTNTKPLCDKFENRYQEEKKKLDESAYYSKLIPSMEEDLPSLAIDAPKGIRK